VSIPKILKFGLIFSSEIVNPKGDGKEEGDGKE
jgi:hypothetical protein